MATAITTQKERNHKAIGELSQAYIIARLIAFPARLAHTNGPGN